MFFAAPIWLLLLMPWGVLTIWLLLGQPQRVGVPFLPLWNSTQVLAKPKRSLRAPPLAVILMLLAIPLAIIGAAGIKWKDAKRPATVSLIVDRGITMSARDRLSTSIDQALKLLRAHGFPSVQITFAPEANRDGANPVAMNTADALRAEIKKRRGEGPAVVVLSDQVIEQHDPQVVQISPQDRPRNVGIVALSARASPRGQLMVQVRNQSDLSSATLSVQSGDVARSQQIRLPARGGASNVFIDLASLGNLLVVTLGAKDDLPIDNVGWLVRQRTWPKVEPIDSLPPEVQRMLDVYRKNRPASAGSTTVSIANDVARLPTSRPGIALSSDPQTARVDPGGLQIISHELTRDIDWKALAERARVAPKPAGDWTPLVSAGDRVLLAVREPVRQVYVGIDARSIADSAQFVVLLGKVFDWAGHGGDVYSTDAVHALDRAWNLILTDPATQGYDAPLPGVYQRADGALLAMSALDVRFAPPVKTDPAALDRLAKDRATWVDLRPVLLGSALGLILIALALLKGR